MVGGLAQITATALLLYSFSFRNFAVGTTYSKTETVQTAIFGILILGDPLGLGAAARDRDQPGRRDGDLGRAAPG